VSGVFTLRGGVAVKLSCGFLLVVVTWQLLFELVQSCSAFFGGVVVVVLTGCLSFQRLVWRVVIFFAVLLLFPLLLLLLL
jgi:hypothetical protein